LELVAVRHAGLLQPLTLRPRLEPVAVRHALPPRLTTPLAQPARVELRQRLTTPLA
jgi:hypothetical protein